MPQKVPILVPEQFFPYLADDVVIFINVKIHPIVKMNIYP